MAGIDGKVIAITGASSGIGRAAGASFADVLRTEIDFLHRHAKVATP